MSRNYGEPTQSARARRRGLSGRPRDVRGVPAVLRLPRRRGRQRPRGDRQDRRAAARHHPDGPRAAEDGRLGSDAAAEGRRAHAAHSDRRADRPRAGRPRRRARGRRAATRSSPSRACRTRWSPRFRRMLRRAAAEPATPATAATRGRPHQTSRASDGARLRQDKDARPRAARRLEARTRASAAGARASASSRAAAAAAARGKLERVPHAAAAAAAARPGRRRPTTRNEGKYVYCIIKSEQPLRFGPLGIGAEPAEVHTVHYKRHRRGRLEHADGGRRIRRATTCSRTSASTRR